ncbi:hypothetical protein Cme02nite_44360 [Catellatospora methionotrophica]|uniref:DUF3710 domain-containing protein n=1 Tax=Catellatospora methionotrophica TaxID=121620 RepID=A0A8J3LIA8_9ACTN|nr:hypothetical protein Cme02nite_44360 [Catellatospora methionotrophica]
MIFSRRRAATGGRHAKAEEPKFVDARAARRAALLGEDWQPEEADRPTAPAANGALSPEPSIFGDDGPYDEYDAPDAPRLDLGSLLLPAVDGVEIRVQAGEQGVIQQIALVHGPNALQLGVFAAPRTEGIWDEVREEIRKSLFADGVGAEEVTGRWGIELRARIRTPEGFNDLRFIGVDGPRWMVRAVFQGPAAVDVTEAGPLTLVLTGLAVRRDDTARPVREALPLRLPANMAEEAAARKAAAEAPAEPPVEQPRQQQYGENAYGDPYGGSGNQLVPGRVPPPPAPTPFGSIAPAGVNGTAAPAAGDVPRRKPSPRPRRD